MALTADTWNVLDNHDEKVTLDNSQTMEGVAEEFKKLNISAKTVEQVKGTHELLKRRSDSKKHFQNLRVSVPEDYPVKNKDSSITIEFVKQVLEGYKMNKPIPYAYAKRITEEVVPLLKKDAPFIDIEIPKDGRIIVVGDTHGQLPDLFEILTLAGYPSINNMYLFNGDLVDRGPHGPEVIFAVYAMKIALPNHVFINRGNHEIRRMNEKYDFKNQMLEKFDAELYEAVSESFLWLPFCSMINQKVLVVHGGIPAGTTLKDLKGLSTELGKPIPSHKNLDTANQRLVENLLWSDPEPTVKTERTNRGAGVLFTAETTRRFLKESKLEVIIRSHQLVDDGYSKMWNGDLITLFSASYYAAKNHNKGAVAIFKHDHEDWKEPTFIQYYGSLMVKSQQEIKANQEADSLHRLYDLIYDNAHSLRLIFEKHAKQIDVSKQPQHIEELENFVTFKDWSTILQDTLQIELQWALLSNYLLKPEIKIMHENEEYIAYSKFLDRFQLKLDERLTNGKKML